MQQNRFPEPPAPNWILAAKDKLPNVWRLASVALVVAALLSSFVFAEQLAAWNEHLPVLLTIFSWTVAIIMLVVDVADHFWSNRWESWRSYTGRYIVTEVLDDVEVVELDALRRARRRVDIAKLDDQEEVEHALQKIARPLLRDLLRHKGRLPVQSNIGTTITIDRIETECVGTAQLELAVLKRKIVTTYNFGHDEVPLANVVRPVLVCQSSALEKEWMRELGQLGLVDIYYPASSLWIKKLGFDLADLKAIKWYAFNANPAKTTKIIVSQDGGRNLRIHWKKWPEEISALRQLVGESAATQGVDIGRDLEQLCLEAWIPQFEHPKLRIANPQQINQVETVIEDEYRVWVSIKSDPGSILYRYEETFWHPCQVSSVSFELSERVAEEWVLAPCSPWLPKLPGDEGEASLEDPRHQRIVWYAKGGAPAMSGNGIAFSWYPSWGNSEAVLSESPPPPAPAPPTPPPD